MAIGEIITGNDIKMIQLSNQRITYVAPTVYRLAKGFNNWNYYATAEDAIKQYNFLMSKPGYKKIAAKGSVSFKTQSAATFGINVDFFLFTGGMGVFPATYEVIKNQMYGQSKYGNALIRFYKTDGSGPYFAILDRKQFGTTATKLSNVEPGKAAAINEFHNTIQLLRAKYNSLASFVLELSKKEKTAVEQQVFDESLVYLLNFKDQLKQLKGVDIVWSSTGQISGNSKIGILPIVWIAIIIISGSVIGFGMYLSYLKDAKAMDAANNTIQFMQDQKLKIAQALRRGEITPADAAALTASADSAQKSAQKNLTDVSNRKDADIFDKITNILLLGGGIFLISKLAKNG